MAVPNKFLSDAMPDLSDDEARALGSIINTLYERQEFVSATWTWLEAAGMSPELRLFMVASALRLQPNYIAGVAQLLVQLTQD